LTKINIRYKIESLKRKECLNYEYKTGQ
jgi:hypothetical protein